MTHDHDHDHEGLHQDLRTLAELASRRKMFSLLAGAGALLVGAACASDDDAAGSSGTAGSGTAGSGTAGSGTTSCSTIPEETGGPYPGDGSNGPNVLTQSGIVRGDIRPSFGGLSGTAEGVPLTITLTLVNVKAGCAPLAGAAVYLWHCDRDGSYSLYTVTNVNYLRGVQETDASGTVTFTTIFPAAYSGRWPHVHFEIFPSLAAATAAGSKLKTSQLALPEAACKEVYAVAGYEKSVANLAATSLTTDNVFSDGVLTQLATVTGDVTSGFAATLTVGVEA